MFKTWGEFIAHLKATFAYDGDGTPASVKQFVTANQIPLQDAEGNALDVDAAHAKWQAKAALVLDVSDADGTDAGNEDEGAESNGRKAASARKASRVVAAHARMAKAGAAGPRDVAKKAYDLAVKRGRAVYADADEAEAAGAWFRLAIAGNAEYAQKAADEEIVAKTAITTTATLGGALIPSDFRAQMIDLREQYGGVIGRVGRRETMSRDVVTFPRVTSDLTVYAPGEAGEITASDMGFDNVTVTATKMAVLSKVSAELFNDSAVSVADQITRNIAWSFEKKLEEILLNGDGTSTYFGFMGVRQKFQKVLEDGGGTWTTDADKDKLAGVVTAAGNTYAEVTLNDLIELTGKFPQYGSGSPAWIVSRPFKAQVMDRLALAQGGVTSFEVVGGVRTDFFLGYPVIYSPAMPKVEANSQVCAIFGDLSMGSIVGEVAGSMSIATSDQRFFEHDIVAYRGLMRAGVTVHDVGNYHATAASEVPGPICALALLNS